jgi:hypothetical protein
MCCAAVSAVVVVCLFLSSRLSFSISHPFFVFLRFCLAPEVKSDKKKKNKKKGGNSASASSASGDEVPPTD